MGRTFRIALVVLAFSSPAAADEQDKLHGEWVSKHPEESSELSLVFGPKNTVSAKYRKSRYAAGTYEIDSAKNPHHLDIHWTQVADLVKNETQLGILAFDGQDKVRIEIARENEPRPRNFSDRAQVFQRLKREAATAETLGDFKKVQGRWHLSGFKYEGEEGEEFKKIAMQNYTLQFKDDLIVSEGESVQVFNEDKRFRLHIDQKQRCIDLTGEHSGNTTLGIYELNGNELKLCINSSGRRPSEFSSKESGCLLLILKREGN